MKVLLIISQLPYPPDTGAKIRTYNLIKKLSEEHSITLVAYGDEVADNNKIAAMGEFCKRIEVVPNKRLLRRPATGGTPRNDESRPEGRSYAMMVFALKNLFSRYPYSVAKYYSKEMASKIYKLIRDDGRETTDERRQYDIIHCDSVQMSLNVSKVKTNIPKVLTEHNIESQIIKRLAQNENNLFKKTYFYIQYLKLSRYEIYAAKQFNHIVTVSQEDKQFLAKYIPENNIAVVPNGVDTEYFRSQGHKVTRSQEEALVFTGSMDWYPNEDAVLYFCKDILPIIWKENEKIKFYIVGRGPSRQIKELGKKDKRIIVTGSVEDVRPYIEKAKVFVVPLRIGGGTRLKILEAMAMGKAVVSTSVGAEGLDVKPEENIILADKPDIFAKQVLKLLGDSSFSESIANRGKKLSEDKYDWGIISDNLEKTWKIAGSIK